MCVERGTVDSRADGNILNRDGLKILFLDQFRECLFQQLAGAFDAWIEFLFRQSVDQHFCSSVAYPTKIGFW